MNLHMTFAIAIRILNLTNEKKNPFVFNNLAPGKSLKNQELRSAQRAQLRCAKNWTRSPTITLCHTKFKLATIIFQAKSMPTSPAKFMPARGLKNVKLWKPLQRKGFGAAFTMRFWRMI